MIFAVPENGGKKNDKFNQNVSFCINVNFCDDEYMEFL